MARGIIDDAMTDPTDDLAARVFPFISNPECLRCRFNNGSMRSQCMTCGKLTGCLEHHICFENTSPHVQQAVHLFLGGADWRDVIDEMERAGPPPGWPKSQG
jgi:hypothetical protein